MTQRPETVELSVPAQPEYVAVVRLTASGIANRMGYSYDDIEDIKVAVSEACTNVVNHAYLDDDNGLINVDFTLFENRVEITIIDKGCSFDYQTVMRSSKPVDMDVPVNQLNEGGLGLFLINTLMDEVVVKDNSGVNVIMTKFLNRDGVEQYVDSVQSSD